MGRIAVIGVIVAALAYGGVSWFFSDRLIGQQFGPLGPVDLAASGLPQPEQTTIPGDGVMLAAWFFEQARSSSCAVVMLHGFGGSRAEVLGASPIFWDRGCDLLLYDARGHGDSSRGLLTYGAHERQDLRLVIDWLMTRTGLQRERIGLIGWSYGAATAIQAASEVDIAFVIADSSFSSLADIANVQAERQFGGWARAFVPGALLVSGLRAGFDPSDAAPANVIGDVEAPVFLVHSRTDGFTPVEHSRLIYERSDQARTRLFIPGWDAAHAYSYPVDPVAYTAAVDGFIDEFAPDFGVRLAR